MCKRIIVLGLAAVLAGLFVAGCSSDDSTEPASSTAKIRIVHTSPDAGPVDVYIGTSVTPWLEDLAYGAASTYLSRNSGTIVLVFRQAGADPATDPGMQSDPISMAAGASLTVVASGLVNSQADEDKFRMITYNDSFQNSPSARARVVHLGSDAPNLTVSVGATGQVLASNLARWADSGQGGNVYEAGAAQDIAVQAAANQVTSFRAPGLEPRKDYYFFLIGQISNTGPTYQEFDLLIVGPGGVEDLDSTEPRRFRLVHASPDGGTVDPYVTYGLGTNFQRIKLMNALSYGLATPYEEVPVHQVFIEFYLVGADPDQAQPVFSQSAYIYDDGNSTTVIAAGLAASQEADDQLRLFSLSDNFDAFPAGLVFVQPVHACPNLDALTVDFGGDGSVEARMDRFTGNQDGWLTLPQDMSHTMVVREEGTTSIVDEFTTPVLAEFSESYLILTGIKDGSPAFLLLTVNEDGSQGFTDPN